MCKLGAALVAAVLAWSAPVVRAMNIVITPDAGLAANPAALAAFNRAAAAWSSQFTNNITINISAGLSNNFVRPNIIGSTSSVKLQAGFDFFRGKLQASAAKEVDDGIVAYLPDLAHFNATLPTGITLSGNFIATKANFKALGYMDLINLDQIYGATDSTITFNSNFSFDYDSSNGVDANKIDFQSVAMHELGHALGFISSVDTVDGLKQAGTGGSLSITPLDLFRFQDNVAGKDPTTAIDVTNDPRFLDTGGNAIFDDLTFELATSTGVYTGDTREASHWKDDQFSGRLLGVMDPSITAGISESLSYYDIHALDLIGYDHVPEPSLLGVSMIVAPLAYRPTQRRGRRRNARA
ncbi:hypothetical protein BH10PLA1_BH10PLA1_02270 [soil metagenome]